LQATRAMVEDAQVTRISLNVVVFNEEARLEECLADARDHVDEIVVVDQMSTDGTPEIAERLADVFIRDVQHGHAEPSRELAAARSSGDWILILDADEKMSDLLKAELPDLIKRGADGYWINKSNVVDGVEVSTVEHFRLVRKARTRFDPRPHGGATAVSDNVEHFERIGIIHEKTVDEQIYDDSRYERIALEEEGPTSSKRNWLSHNRTLRAQRARRIRTDLEALVPADARRVLVVGDLPIELAGRSVSRISERRPKNGSAPSNGKQFDAAVVELSGRGARATLRSVAGLVRSGGVIVGTAPAARNRRRMEEFISTVLADGISRRAPAAAGTSRRELLDDLAAAGLDARWMTIVRDGWLTPVALRPDGSGSIVESEEFLLKRVAADAAEELSAEELVFAAVRTTTAKAPSCSVVLVTPAGMHPQPFVDALQASATVLDYELVVVGSQPCEPPIAGARSVLIPETATLAARWNAGARAARGDLLVFASAEATPLPGWLDVLAETYRSRPDTGCVGSRILAEDGTIGHAGLVLGPDRVPYRLYEGDPADADYVNRPRIMPAVLAEGMVTSRMQFVAIGGFDETLGEDLTDADYCMRLRARGCPVLYAPSAVLRSPLRPAPGTRGSFRSSAREFAARWSPAASRSDALVCGADGRDSVWEWNRSWRLPRPTAPSTGGLPAIAWSSHFLESGGYTEEAIATVEALDDAGLCVIASPIVWDRLGTPMPARKAERLAALLTRDLPEEFVHVAHIGANRFKRHPAAICNVGRTMYETDGLPADWRDQCNVMDEIWVPAEHNLRTFAAAGVDPSKLHKVPETFDTALFDPGVKPLDVDDLEGFVFLSVFSWINRKAWDILLRAWFAEFKARDDVTLLLKTDAALAPPGTDCRREVEAFVRDQLGIKPGKGPRIAVLDTHLETADVPRMYRTADAFVLASHGEGWGRPYMEAMAMGMPTIATRWSGNLDFMDDENSYLLDYTLVDVPAHLAPRGQRWAEPSLSDLRRTMRRLYEHPKEAARTGERARADVLVSCSPEVVATAVSERLEAIARRVRRARRAKVSQPPAGAAAPQARARRAADGRRLSACVVVHGDAPYLPQCLSSLEAVADSVVVVEAESGEDMAAVRNEALDRATGSWVLMLDAAQTLDPASVDVVHKLVRRNRFVGYAARELHQFGLDGAVSSIEQRSVFLFPRYPDLRYVGRAAEQLLPQRRGLEFGLVPSQIVLHRHDHRPDGRGTVAWARHHLPFLERSMREAPDEPFHRYNLGVALHQLGLHAEAEKRLRRAIKRAPRRALWAPSAYASLARAVAAQGRALEAAKPAEIATELAPDWAAGWCMLGDVWAAAGRQDQALQAYERALDCGEQSLLPGAAPDDTVWQVRRGIARIHFAREEYADAADCLAPAVALHPSSPELRVMLAQAYEGAGLSAEARRQFELAVSGARGGADTYLAFGDFFAKKAEEALLRGLVDNAESPPLLRQIERLREVRGSA
jgi:glycosyltransferase involved in cell wall biosynthesis/GT2 family glycosyltransferase/tetratricopeptide (TPR) repeat protein